MCAFTGIFCIKLSLKINRGKTTLKVTYQEFFGGVANHLFHASMVKTEGVVLESNPRRRDCSDTQNSHPISAIALGRMSA